MTALMDLLYVNTGERGMVSRASCKVVTRGISFSSLLGGSR